MKSFQQLVYENNAIVNCVDEIEIRVEAPPFHTWNCDDVHEIVCCDVQDARERMLYGVDRCTDPECEWCADNRKLTVYEGGKQ